MPSKKHDPDEDPVTNEFDVFVTPKLAEQLYLLQFPTRSRDMPYNEDSRNKPSEMRIKPQTGFIEMDVPFNTELYYNREQANKWGEALTKSKSSGTKGHGIAVGFAQSRGSGQQGDADEEDFLLSHQTLGGQIMHDERGRPNYMIGTFLTDKRELHLTGLDGVVQMRPQFHHLDARVQLDRNIARRNRAGAGESLPKEPQQVMVSFADDEEMETNATKTLLEKAQTEPWKRMRFFDEEETMSYTSYNEHLFLEEDQKKNELESALNNEKYLDAISAPRIGHNGKPRVKPMTKKQKVQIEMNVSDEESGVEP